MSRIALVTGASQGLGEAMTRELSVRGWHVIITARGVDALARVGGDLSGPSTMVPGDINDPNHRAALGAVVERLGGLDLLINNAGTLGPSPLPGLAALQSTELRELLDVNVVAPLALFQAVLPALSRSGGIVINMSSDAAVEAYPGWGAYGASKAALDHLSAVLAVEHPELLVYAIDPGDMRTAMHQAAFPGEDISDRPLPDVAAARIFDIVEQRPPSGRLRPPAEMAS